MKFKAVIYPWVLSRFIKFILWALLSTCRYEIKGLKTFVELAQKQPVILALWHNKLLIVGHFLTRHTPKFIYKAFISKSRDGQILAAFTSSYKNGRTIRVPHHARNLALKSMIDSLKTTNDVILFTPDGPRGPIYKIKPGIIMAAKESEATIIPLRWTSSRYWELRTWDKMKIPKPFSKIQISLGSPILPNDLTTELLEQELKT